MFNMNNIINHNRLRRQQQLPRRQQQLPRRQQQLPRRQQFQLRTGYFQSVSSPTPPSTPNNNSNTIIEESHIAQSPPTPTSLQLTQELSDRLQYNLFNTIIDVSANNFTSNLYANQNRNNGPEYYSTFNYESLNIRFFHDELLNFENISEAIDNVISNINEREIQNILNDFENSETNNTNTNENTEEIKQKINKNVTHGEYVHYSASLKNDCCPILLTDFENDDIVSIFNVCYHAIHESTYEKFIHLFTKCPLCNSKLFEL